MNTHLFLGLGICFYIRFYWFHTPAFLACPECLADLAGPAPTWLHQNRLLCGPPSPPNGTRCRCTKTTGTSILAQANCADVVRLCLCRPLAPRREHVSRLVAMDNVGKSFAAMLLATAAVLHAAAAVLPGAGHRAAAGCRLCRRPQTTLTCRQTRPPPPPPPAQRTRS